MCPLGTGIRNATNQAKLIGALCAQSKGIRIIYGRPPPAEAAEFRDWLSDVSIGRLQNLEMVDSEKERERIRLKLKNLRAKVKAVPNGRFWLDRVEHFCYSLETGAPC